MRAERAIRRAPTALAGWLLAVSPFVVSAQDTPDGGIRDLYYGEVLFHFYQQDEFTALTHLLAARDAGRVEHHAAEAELLQGGLYLSYGQHRLAGEIFERLLTQTSDPEVRDRAWFYVGKVRYRRGLFASAIDAFGRVGEDLPAFLRPELQLFLAQSHMARGEFTQAVTVLEADREVADMRIGYLRYNLGVALIRLERVEEGARLLERVGLTPGETPELAALRDKANLTIGYAYLQAGRPAEARSVLSGVRLHGPFSSKALLGVGWADAMQDDYRAALGPWLELGERDLLDSAVQESLLAVPYAFSRLGADGSAARHYRAAIDAFEVEKASLDGAIARARSGELVPALLQSDDRQIGRWHWQLDTLPDSDDARYLYHLVANNEFQDGLRSYRDLVALHEHLAAWQDKPRRVRRHGRDPRARLRPAPAGRGTAARRRAPGRLRQPPRPASSPARERREAP